MTREWDLEEQQAALEALREPFPAEAIGKLPRSTCKNCTAYQACDRHSWVSNCSECHGRHASSTIHLDYVGHADVTARLLEVDPAWTWQPLALDDRGLPGVDREGNLWITLTVAGVDRLGVGDGKNAKERIGDALRNAAMRFGVALDLWAKGDREWAHADRERAADEHPDQPAPAAPQGEPYHGPTASELLLEVDQYAARAGKTYEEFTGKWRREHGGLTVADLDTQDPRLLTEWVQSLEAYFRAHPPEGEKSVDHKPESAAADA